MKQPGKMGQHPSEMIPRGAKQGSQWTEITPQCSEMIPQLTEMIPQRTEMVAQPTEMAPHAAEITKQYCGTISVADYSNNASFSINFDNEIIF